MSDLEHETDTEEREALTMLVDDSGARDSGDPADGESGAEEETDARADRGGVITDLVDLYFKQMTEIHLLTREQEIAAAKEIEVARRRFRQSVLRCHWALRTVVRLQEEVHQGVRPLSRTMRVTKTGNATKEQIRGRMPANLRTLHGLLGQTKDNFREVLRLQTEEVEKVHRRRELRRQMGMRSARHCVK